MTYNIRCKSNNGTILFSPREQGKPCPSCRSHLEFNPPEATTGTNYPRFATTRICSRSFAMFYFSCYKRLLCKNQVHTVGGDKFCPNTTCFWKYVSRVNETCECNKFISRLLIKQT